MRLLVLGGTIFLGRHLVEAALASGHDVTIVHRGRHGAELFAGVERIVGDRNEPGGLDALRGALADGRRWDAVIDTCGFLPRHVRVAADLLRSAVDSYCFISSISVYADLSVVGIDESAPVGEIDDPTTEEVTGDSYGPLKALCEREVAPNPLVIRPGLIVGPHDPSGRFAYWPMRFDRGGSVLVPAPPDQAVQLIDARDLASFVLACLGEGRTGVIHATGEPVTFAAVVDAAERAAERQADKVWVDEAFLIEHGVEPWVGLPLWIPAGAGMPGFQRIDVSAAKQAGMVTRPLRDTMQDTLEWARRSPSVAIPDTAPVLRPEREAQVLAAWTAEQSVR